MAKDKKSSKSAKAAPAVSKPIEAVKAGRVTKPIEQPKAVAKDIAKKAANGIEKASKKVKKAVEPEPDSDSDTSESSASSDEEAEDDASSDSESSSDASSESEEEVAPKKVKADGKSNGKVKGKAAPPPASDSEEDSDDSSDASSDDEEDAKAGVNGAKADDDSSEGSSSDSDSDSDSDESADEEEKPAAKTEEGGKKRKAEEAIEQTPKKLRFEVEGEMKDATANLFVGNLSWNVDEEWLTREFEDIGDLKAVRIITDRDSGRSKGFGYIEYNTIEKAAEAFEAKQGLMLDGRNLRLDFSIPRQQRDNNATPQQRSSERAARFGDAPKEPSLTLFVGNVSFDADESMIGEMFQEYGSVSSVRLPTDRETGALKGFGYVEFGSIDDAKAAYEALQGADLAGRPVRLDYSTPRSTDSPRGGGFSRGGRGGGRGGFGDRGGRGGGRGGRGGFGDRGRGGSRGGRGGTTNRGGFGDFSGKKMTF